MGEDDLKLNNFIIDLSEKLCQIKEWVSRDESARQDSKIKIPDSILQSFIKCQRSIEIIKILQHSSDLQLIEQVAGIQQLQIKKNDLPSEFLGFIETQSNSDFWNEVSKNLASLDLTPSEEKQQHLEMIQKGAELISCRNEDEKELKNLLLRSLYQLRKETLREKRPFSPGSNNPESSKIIQNSEPTKSVDLMQKPQSSLEVERELIGLGQEPRKAQSPNKSEAQAEISRILGPTRLEDLEKNSLPENPTQETPKVIQSDHSTNIPPVNHSNGKQVQEIDPQSIFGSEQSKLTQSYSHEISQDPQKDQKISQEETTTNSVTLSELITSESRVKDPTENLRTPPGQDANHTSSAFLADPDGARFSSEQINPLETTENPKKQPVVLETGTEDSAYSTSLSGEQDSKSQAASSSSHLEKQQHQLDLKFSPPSERPGVNAKTGGGNLPENIFKSPDHFPTQATLCDLSKTGALNHPGQEQNPKSEALQPTSNPGFIPKSPNEELRNSQAGDQYRQGVEAQIPIQKQPSGNEVEILKQKSGKLKQQKSSSKRESQPAMKELINQIKQAAEFQEHHFKSFISILKEEGVKAHYQLGDFIDCLLNDIGLNNISAPILENVYHALQNTRKIYSVYKGLDEERFLLKTPVLDYYQKFVVWLKHFDQAFGEQSSSSLRPETQASIDTQSKSTFDPQFFNLLFDLQFFEILKKDEDKMRRVESSFSTVEMYLEQYPAEKSPQENLILTQLRSYILENYIKPRKSTPGQQTYMTSIQDRQLYYLSDLLNVDENEQLDYKNYSYPLKEHPIESIQNTICAFLNFKGGIILIGVDDDSVVKGMLLDFNQRDHFRMKLFNELLSKFDPPLNKNPGYKEVELDYVPVFLKDKNQPIKDKWVSRITVQPGFDQKQLYTYSTRLRCYIRNNNMNQGINIQDLKMHVIKKYTSNLCYPPIKCAPPYIFSFQNEKILEYKAPTVVESQLSNPEQKKSQTLEIPGVEIVKVYLIESDYRRQVEQIFNEELSKIDSQWSFKMSSLLEMQPICLSLKIEFMIPNDPEVEQLKQKKYLKIQKKIFRNGLGWKIVHGQGAQTALLLDMWNIILVCKSLEPITQKDVQNILKPFGVTISRIFSYGPNFVIAMKTSESVKSSQFQQLIQERFNEKKYFTYYPSTKLTIQVNPIEQNRLEIEGIIKSLLPSTEYDFVQGANLYEVYFKNISSNLQQMILIYLKLQRLLKNPLKPYLKEPVSFFQMKTQQNQSNVNQTGTSNNPANNGFNGGVQRFQQY